jgi:hypothetical protein
MDIRLSQIFGEECLDLGARLQTSLEKWALYSDDPEVARQLRMQLSRWLKKAKIKKSDTQSAK